MGKNDNQALHKKIKSMSAPLSADLREKYGFRSISVREGDRVRVTRGDFWDAEGEITEVNTDRERIVVEGVETATADETEVPIPIHPSNVEITKLEKDEMREKIIDRRSEYGEERREETLEETEHAEDVESAEEEE